jgi:hypothetical protein
MLKKTFAVFNEMVRDGAIEDYALAGAVGATFYVQPFATQDVDVLVWMPQAESGLIAELPGLEYLRERGYSEMSGEGVVIEDWPVQFIPINSPLDEEAYLNAETIPYDDIPVRVVLAEHLVAIMLRVGRPKDLARIHMFLSQDAIDNEALSDIIQRHGLADKWREFQNKFL